MDGALRIKQSYRAPHLMRQLCSYLDLFEVAVLFAHGIDCYQDFSGQSD